MLKQSPAAIQETVAEAVIKLLPHGSGINDKWQWEYQKDGKLVCNNAFHCTNEDGFSCGYANFHVKIDPRKALTAFEITFQGQRSQWLADRYGLRDYLVDTVYHALTQGKVDGHKTSLYMLKKWAQGQSVFIVSRTKEAAMKRSMMPHPIAVQVNGGYVVYNAY